MGTRTADQLDLHGIVPYLVSPIDADSGAIRRDVLAALCTSLIGAGVHGLSPLGSTGEFPFLSSAQRVGIVETVVEASGGRVPVIPAVGAFSTADAVVQAQDFVAAGADALVVVLQQFFPLSPAEAESYFADVARSVDVPICLYTNPGVLGGDLTAASIERLCEVPNIRYIKDASGVTGRLISILNRCEGRLGIFSASAHIPLLVLQLGGVGWMGGPICVLPEESVALFELAQAGRWDAALLLQRELWQLNELFQQYSFAKCIKTALEIQGFEVGAAISPQSPLTAADAEVIRSRIDTIRERSAEILGTEVRG